MASRPERPRAVRVVSINTWAHYIVAGKDVYGRLNRIADAIGCVIRVSWGVCVFHLPSAVLLGAPMGSIAVSAALGTAVHTHTHTHITAAEHM